MQVLLISHILQLCWLSDMESWCTGDVTCSDSKATLENSDQLSVWMQGPFIASASASHKTLWLALALHMLLVCG